jgi:hypothetical protein
VVFSLGRLNPLYARVPSPFSRFKNLVLGAGVCYGCYRLGEMHEARSIYRGDTAFIETFFKDFFEKNSFAGFNKGSVLEEESSSFFYKNFVGSYELRGRVAHITLHQGTLYVDSVGFYQRELIPVAGSETEFTVKHQKEYTVRFVLDERKQVAAIEITKKMGPWFSISATAYPQKS